MSEATPIEAHQHDCLNVMTTMTPMNMSNWSEKCPQRHKPTWRTTNNWVKLAVEEVVFHQERTYQLAVQCQTVSPKNIHIGSTTWSKQVIFRNTYAFLITISSKNKGHEFEEWRGVYRRAWREEIEEGNDVIILISRNKGNNF